MSFLFLLSFFKSLELDGGLDLVDAASQVVGVRDRGGELAGLGQTRTQETRDLLDESLGSDEGIVLAGKLLDELLVLVELLQVISGHGIDTTVLGTINIVLVTENADGHVGAGDGRQADGARETLVTLRVIVLQADLKLNGLEEVALLGLVGVLQELTDLRTDISDCDFRHLGSLPIGYLMVVANMTFATSCSVVISTLPTATPMQRTFLSWNLMVDLTSLMRPERSSA
jgi:hypothetical protein